MPFRPDYISFDCYGTLINYEMGPLATTLFADRVSDELLEPFLKSFKAYRLDECLGEFKPLKDVVVNAIARTCATHGVECRDSDGEALYAAIPTWQPHPHVVETLEAIAPHYPLVILSNSMVDLIPASVAHLKAKFHDVCTAEEAQAYKPRMRAFEYMFDRLGSSPERMMHCSSSFRYDQMIASDLGFGSRMLVERGHEPDADYDVTRLRDFRDLPRLLGL